jgi:heme/copper-type cytochrome/quinol oxidase subunit 2
MTATRRTLGLMLIGAGACLLAGPAAARLLAHGRAAAPEVIAGQEQAPNRREFTVTARDYRFSPDRLEVLQDDLVKVTVQSADHAYSLTIDEYRVSRRVPAGGTTTLEFRADQPGTFTFYSNLTSDARHTKMNGQLIVRAK